MKYTMTLNYLNTQMERTHPHDIPNPDRAQIYNTYSYIAYPIFCIYFAKKKEVEKSILQHLIV